MNKFLVIFLGVFVGTPLFGASMCVHTNSYIGLVLRGRDGTITTKSDISTTGIGTFRVSFNYNTSNRGTEYIDGVALCSDDITDLHVVGNDDASAMKTNDAILGGLFGARCWCGMLFPMTSEWVSGGDYSSDSECATNCTTACATSVANDSVMRSNLFDTVWPG